jgi:hypothetical protein
MFYALSEYPVFLVNQLHQVDARDLHGVAHARNLPEAAGTWCAHVSPNQPGRVPLVTCRAAARDAESKREADALSCSDGHAASLAGAQLVDAAGSMYPLTRAEAAAMTLNTGFTPVLRAVCRNPGRRHSEPASTAADHVNSTSTANSASFRSCSYSVCTSTDPFALILRESLCSGLP